MSAIDFQQSLKAGGNGPSVTSSMMTSCMVNLGAEMLGFGMAMTSLLVKGKSSMQSYCKSYRSSYRNSYPFFGGALLHAHDAQVERLLAEPSSRLTARARLPTPGLAACGPAKVAGLGGALLQLDRYQGRCPAPTGLEHGDR